MLLWKANTCKIPLRFLIIAEKMMKNRGNYGQSKEILIVIIVLSFCVHMGNDRFIGSLNATRYTLRKYFLF